MICGNCGAQLTGASCAQCGAAQPSIHSVSPSPSPARAAKSRSIGKVLLVVAAVIVFLGVAFAGTVWYGWHKLKQAAASQGINLDGLSDSGPARPLDACQLLTKEDLGQILNLSIDRSEGTGSSTHSTCRYYSSAAQRRGSEERDAAVKKLEDNANSSESPAQQEEAVREVERMVRGIGGARAGATGNDVLTVEVDSGTAKAAMAGFRLGSGISAAVVTGDAKPAARKFFYEDIKGIGDEAAFGPLGSLLMFRKGDVSVKIDARTLPSGRDAEIAIARSILTKL